MKTVSKVILSALVIMLLGSTAFSQQKKSSIVETELNKITTTTTQAELDAIVDKLVKMYPGNEEVHAALYVRIKEIIQAFTSSTLVIEAVTIAFDKALDVERRNRIIEIAKTITNIDARKKIKTNDASSPST